MLFITCWQKGPQIKGSWKEKYQFSVGKKAYEESESEDEAVFYLVTKLARSFIKGKSFLQTNIFHEELHFVNGQEHVATATLW